MPSNIELFILIYDAPFIKQHLNALCSTSHEIPEGFETSVTKGNCNETPSPPPPSWQTCFCRRPDVNSFAKISRRRTSTSFK